MATRQLWKNYIHSVWAPLWPSIHQSRAKQSTIFYLIFKGMLFRSTGQTDSDHTSCWPSISSDCVLQIASLSPVHFPFEHYHLSTSSILSAYKAVEAKSGWRGCIIGGDRWMTIQTIWVIIYKISFFPVRELLSTWEVTIISILQIKKPRLREVKWHPMS